MSAAPDTAAASAAVHPRETPGFMDRLSGHYEECSLYLDPFTAFFEAWRLTWSGR